VRFVADFACAFFNWSEQQISVFTEIGKIILINIVFFVIACTQLENLIGSRNIANASSPIKTSELVSEPSSTIDRSIAIPELPLLNPTWKYLDFQSLPPPRFGFSLVLNPKNDVAILFGGRNSNLGQMNDLWMTDGFEWIQYQTLHSPGKRSNASMAYDVARQGAVLFGGNDYEILLGDTWVFDGVDWIQQNPPQSPPARIDACMAYDPDRNLVILFGGLGDTGGDFWEALDDMWVWDGTDWQQQFPAHLPPARFGANMAYDNARHMMLLFGGGVGGGLLDDTWIWDGIDWTEHQPKHRPPGRANFGMAYDEIKQVVIIYGGQGGPINATDTWEWLGNDWGQLQTIHKPPEQLSYRANLVYSPGLQTVMLLNDHRTISFDPDGNPIFTENLEGWALTYQYLSLLPMITK